MLYLVLHILSIYGLLKAYRRIYSFWVAAGVVAIIRFATVVPNAPGNLGVVNVACVTALRLFDFPENDAKTFSFIMWAALTLPLLLGGAVATALTGVEHRGPAGPRQAGHAGHAGSRNSPLITISQCSTISRRSTSAG